MMFMQRRNHTVLVVTHVVPVPPAAGNEYRVCRLLAWLRQSGFRTVLFITVPIPPDRVNGVRALVDRLYHANDSLSVRHARVSVAAARLLLMRAALKWRRWMGQMPEYFFHGDGEPEVVRVMCNRYVVDRVRQLAALHSPRAVVVGYIGLSPCLEALGSGPVRIIDTHESFSAKHANVLAHGLQDSLACSEEEERRCLDRADVIMAIQAEEAALFRRLVPGRRVITVGVDVDVSEKTPADCPAPPTVLIVGSDHHGNVHGAERFCAVAWPKVRARRPDAVLRIVGKLSRCLRSGEPGVRLDDWVPDLSEAYRTAAVVVNPNLAGTGLKIKSVEALCHGKSLVALPNGVAGLSFTGEAPYVVSESWDRMADDICNLLDSKDRRQSLERRAREYARLAFSPAAAYAELNAILAGGGSDACRSKLS